MYQAHHPYFPYHRTPAQEPVKVRNLVSILGSIRFRWSFNALSIKSICQISGLRYKPQRCDLNLEEIFCGGWGRSDDSGIGLIGVKYVERLSRYGGGYASYMLLLGSLTNQEFEEL